MKKNYFLLAMAAGMMSFASCSSDDAVNGSEEWADGDQVIMLDMQDTDVLASRSRPLYSTANMGAEKVTDVKLLVFKIDGSTKTLTKEFNISNWNNESSDYQYGRQYTFRIPKADRLESGKYTIVAVGQDEATETVAPYTWGNPATTLPVLDITDGATWNSATTTGNGFAELIPNAVTADPAEIFSGQSQPVTIGTDGEAFTATVLLKRQVAGVLGYFDRIPASVDVSGTPTAVTNIRLVASKKNTKLDLTINLEDQNDDTTGNDPIECVVNGFELATPSDATFKYLDAPNNGAYVVYDIDLKEWFTWDTTNNKWADGSTYSDDMGTPSDNTDDITLLNPTAWVNAIDATNTEVKVADGAVMAGKFMIPFKKFSDAGLDKETFELQLLGSTGAILKSWRVKLDAGSQNAELGDGPYVYNIYRNHLYQIGQRGNGDNPNNPGEGGDDPQPLDKINEQELVIKINDQWEFIHNMEIE